MTIAVAALGDDGVWLASDGRAECNGNVVSLRMQKWTISPDGLWAVSHSGSLAYRDASRRIFDEFSQWEAVPENQEGAVRVLQIMREGLGALPAGPKPITDENDVFADWRWSPIIASPSGLWRSDSTLWTIDPPSVGGGGFCAYFCAGSGTDRGLGAMHALCEGGERSAERLVRAAVSSACTHDPGCGGALWIQPMQTDGNIVRAAQLVYGHANGSGGAP